MEKVFVPLAGLENARYVDPPVEPTVVEHTQKLEPIIFTIISFAILLSVLYYFFWIKIETVAKPLVGAIIVIAILYVGSDLLITVFSYGTWAVFFKKLVGSILIVLPISYVLYWLEQHKIRKRLFKEKDLTGEYSINNFKEPTAKKYSINIDVEIKKSFAWFINRTLPTKITIVASLLILFFVYTASINNESYQSDGSYSYNAATEEAPMAEEVVAPESE
ncbi:hypothetical protein [Sulfuricurvum sp.]|uniref:hypothetical protein n=1 Tax=Sulfuricurvum sp. TaxID=2025608 RepID=UPI002E341865|nr:hypothetical protein [Sulfuricurvum sp.]HEX5329425.1 hypothetical protein [Sulfuricurvum sp.]